MPALQLWLLAADLQLEMLAVAAAVVVVPAAAAAAAAYVLGLRTCRLPSKTPEHRR